MSKHIGKTRQPITVSKKHGLLVTAPSFKYVHETIVPTEKFPKNTTIRSINTNGHIIRIMSWGKVIGRTMTGQLKHEHSQVQGILHPKEGKCNLIDNLKQKGKLTDLLDKGRIILKNVVGLQFLPCPVCRIENPVPRANLRLKCSNCGISLLSVKVRKVTK